MRIIDLRSDTITKPSPEMWEMIKSLDNSKIGDDVYGEDPTINELEEKAAKIMGKEAALYVTSGTQGNLVSLLAHIKPNDELLLEDQSHIYLNEIGSLKTIGRFKPKLYSSTKGVPSMDDLEVIMSKEIPNNIKLICSENTHNYHGETIMKPEDLSAVNIFSREYELKYHLDGARIFNAAVGLKVPVTEFIKHVDSVMFCLSKGLSCPVGSIVTGTKKFISEARKYRKLLGSAMRQAGVIAAFGLVALKPNWIQRLEEDHKNAKILAEGIQGDRNTLNIYEPETNIVIIEFSEKIRILKIVRSLANKGIIAFNINKQTIRFVTHYGITKDDIEYSIYVINAVLNEFL